MPTASIDEIWLVDFGEPFPDEPASVRPAMAVGPASPLEGMPWLVVVPLTTSDRGLPFHEEIHPSAGTGLSATSFAQCELVRSVSRRRLKTRLGVVSPLTAFRVRQILSNLLDM